MSENKVQTNTTPAVIAENTDETVELTIDKKKAAKWTAYGVFALGSLWLLNDKIQQLRGKSDTSEVTTEYVIVETTPSNEDTTPTN